MALASVPPLVEPGPPLSAAELERFSRHVLLPQVGELGQRRLRNARVCVLGAGGLGAPVLQYLAAAGVGQLGIVDDDVVDRSNLQRQVIHVEADVGRPKVDSARDAVLARSPEAVVVVHHERLEAHNAEEILGGYDLVVDGTDNFPTRYLVADSCERLGLPYVWGSIFRFDAQVSVFWADPPANLDVPAVGLRDLFPEAPAPGTVPSCAEGGVLGPLCGQVGSLMATEVIKLVTGVGHPLLGRVAVLDALTSRWLEVPLARASAQPSPGEDRETSDQPAAPLPAPSAPGAKASWGQSPHAAPSVGRITAPELALRLEARRGGTEDFVLLDVREPYEYAAAAIPGSVLVPLGSVLDGSGLRGVDPRRPVVVLCHAGVRSMRAGEVMLARGFERVDNLEGGIVAWLSTPEGAACVESSTPR